MTWRGSSPHRGAIDCLDGARWKPASNKISRIPNSPADPPKHWRNPWTNSAAGIAVPRSNPILFSTSACRRSDSARNDVAKPLNIAEPRNAKHSARSLLPIHAQPMLMAGRLANFNGPRGVIQRLAPMRWKPTPSTISSLIQEKTPASRAGARTTGKFLNGAMVRLGAGFRVR